MVVFERSVGGFFKDMGGLFGLRVVLHQNKDQANFEVGGIFSEIGLELSWYQNIFKDLGDF